MNGYYSHKKYKYIKQVSIEEKKINNVLNFKAMWKIWLFKTIIAVAMDFSKSKIFYVIFYGTLTSVAATLLCCITKFFVVYNKKLDMFLQVQTKTTTTKILKSGIKAYHNHLQFQRFHIIPWVLYDHVNLIQLGSSLIRIWV